MVRKRTFFYFVLEEREGEMKMKADFFLLRRIKGLLEGGRSFRGVLSMISIGSLNSFCFFFLMVLAYGLGDPGSNPRLCIFSRFVDIYRNFVEIQLK